MLIVPVCGAGGPHLARVLSLTVLENSSTADQNKTAAFLNNGICRFDSGIQTAQCTSVYAPAPHNESTQSLQKDSRKSQKQDEEPVKPFKGMNALVDGAIL